MYLKQIFQHNKPNSLFPIYEKKYKRIIKNELVKNMFDFNHSVINKNHMISLNF